MKDYISGAGGTIVSKSILSGKAKLKWLFRDESEYGNGWVAFGDTDTQEYVNNVENMEIVDFNTLANIEPTVVMYFTCLWAVIWSFVQIRRENILWTPRPERKSVSL